MCLHLGLSHGTGTALRRSPSQPPRRSVPRSINLSSWQQCLHVSSMQCACCAIVVRVLRHLLAADDVLGPQAQVLHPVDLDDTAPSHLHAQRHGSYHRAFASVQTPRSIPSPFQPGPTQNEPLDRKHKEQAANQHASATLHDCSDASDMFG